MGEEKLCGRCGRRRGRTASIYIEGRGDLLVCIPCADEEDRRKSETKGTAVMNKRALNEGDAEINARLLEDHSPVTFCPTTRETRAYFVSLGLTPTEDYVERFRSGVITAGMGASLRGAQVTAAEVAQLIADDVEEAVTGHRPARPSPPGTPPARLVVITSGEAGRGGRGCAFAIVLPARPGDPSAGNTQEAGGETRREEPPA